MPVLRGCKRIGSLAFVPLFFGLMGQCASGGQETVDVTEITPTVVVFATSTGNVVASVGPDGALLVGTPSAGSTPQISRTLANRTKSTVRYIVVWPEATGDSEGDAGWGQRGAFVAMQENALTRLGGHVMGPSRTLPPRLIELGVDRPHVSFSDVLSFDMNGDAIHVVHQKPGYSDADAIAHFHAAKLVYLGEVFPGDGYPLIDRAQGGTLDGLLKTLGAWAGSTMRVVPARGKVASGTDVKAFRDMIVTVRDRVQQSIGKGETESQIVAEHPAAEFDSRWGHGRVSSDAFVSAIYSALETSGEVHP